MLQVCVIDNKFRELQAALDFGFEAYLNKVPYGACPYKAASLKCAWREGWEEAQAEDFSAKDDENIFRTC